MTPRLKTSKKWTPVPKELAEQIQTLLVENFSKNLNHASLIVEGRIYPEELILRIGVKNKGEISQANIEISANYSMKEKNIIPTVHLCVDAGASLLMDYFDYLKTQSEDSDNEFELPRSWSEFEFENQKIWAQFSAVNSDLERQADELLGMTNENIYNEDEESEDPQTSDETEQSEEIEESFEPEEPRMFGKAPKKNKNQLH